MDGAVVTVFAAPSVADWRRRIAETYAGIRAAPDHAVQAWEGWRAVRDNMIKTHPASPVSVDERNTFGDLAYFDYDPSLRFLVATTNPADTTPEIMVLADDGKISMDPVMETVGLADKLGAELTIFWINGYGGGLFLPFKDDTNGSETFSGGRYLIDAIKGADLGTVEDGRLVIDFNFAYNPSCAYAPQWSCPLAPTRNALPNAVRAGEKHAANAA